MLEIFDRRQRRFRKLAKQYKKNHEFLTAAQDIVNELLEANATPKKIEKASEKVMKHLKIRHAIEKDLIDIRRGLYIGFGIDMDNTELGMQPIYLDWGKLENHDDTFGTTQYGKTYKLGSDIRQYIKRRDNIFIVDPKGGKKRELMGWTIDALAEEGIPHWLLYLNPLFPELSVKVNPIFGMTNEELASTSALLSQGGGATTTGDSGFYGGFSYKVTLAALTSLQYLELVTSSKESISKEIKDEVKKHVENERMRGMKTVSEDELNNLIIPDVTERVTYAFANSEENTQRTEHSHSPVYFKRTLITFKELAYFTQFHNLEKLRESVMLYDVPEDAENYQELYELRLEAQALIDEIVLKDPRFYEKVATSLSTLFIQLSTGSIGTLLCSSRINPLVQRMYDDKRGLVCLMETVPMKFRQVSDIMLKVFMKMLESVFGSVGASGRELPRRTQFFIDEGKAAVFPGIEEIYNKAASAGLTVHALYQSPQDRVSKLGDVDAAVVGDNVNTMYLMNLNDKNSQKALAEAFSTQNKVVGYFMSDAGGSGGRFSAMGEQKELVTPASIEKLDKGEAYVRHYGKRYHVLFPFQMPPRAKLEMPELDEERRIKEINGYERTFNETLTVMRILAEAKTTEEAKKKEKEAEVE